MSLVLGPVFLQILSNADISTLHVRFLCIFQCYEDGLCLCTSVICTAFISIHQHSFPSCQSDSVQTPSDRTRGKNENLIQFNGTHVQLASYQNQHKF